LGSTAVRFRGQGAEDEGVGIIAEFEFVGVVLNDEEMDEDEVGGNNEVGIISCPIARAFADPQQSSVPSALQHQRPPEDALQGWTTFDCGESSAVFY
jgi:hypothetical protein